MGRVRILAWLMLRLGLACSEQGADSVSGRSADSEKSAPAVTTTPRRRAAPLSFGWVVGAAEDTE